MQAKKCDCGRAYIGDNCVCTRVVKISDYERAVGRTRRGALSVRCPLIVCDASPGEPCSEIGLKTPHLAREHAAQGLLAGRDARQASHELQQTRDLVDRLLARMGE
jgi:hypothetical protein